ncbi:serine/threonine-protein kinase 16 isoform X2 [Hemitrygon akajei]|uniref:serine/threonine-protein kinase 16 isoform X2 n=1 Tax=Hemitrygon akajei TaxID=2704970 RepID=UPI003BF9611B
MGQAVCICSRGIITIDNKRYLFIQNLDEGGFSYVDLVESVQDGKFYALKRIICHDKEDRKNALTEVEMHRMFNHPNVLPLEAYSIIDKSPKCETWLLLPYIKNGSLWTELEKLRNANNFMAEEQILSIFLGLCKGLKAIHDKGYAHRDLKPTNVLLDDYQQPVLMDLGSMTKARIEVKGSREAMTIQSLGCVLYAMMFLEGPYDGIFQKGDCVALAVQNPITIPENCRYTQSLQHLLTSMMVVNLQERPNINWVLNQTEQLQPAGAVQDTKMI